MGPLTATEANLGEIDRGGLFAAPERQPGEGEGGTRTGRAYEGGRAEIDALAAQGALREDADRLWATLQRFFLIWAPLSFMPLLEREALDGSLLEERSLERWVTANIELLEKGLYR